MSKASGLELTACERKAQKVRKWRGLQIWSSCHFLWSVSEGDQRPPLMLAVEQVLCLRHGSQIEACVEIAWRALENKGAGLHHRDSNSVGLGDAPRASFSSLFTACLLVIILCSLSIFHFLPIALE